MIIQNRIQAMTGYQVQSHYGLFNVMKAVVQGEKPAPADASAPSMESTELLLSVLADEKRELRHS